MNLRPSNQSAPARAGSRLDGAGPGRSGFTLVELILVMSVLVVVLALVAPSLTRFFKGRTLDSEARRLISLTHYGQSRAVAEGIPMILWIDPDLARYGLESEYSFTEIDDKAVDYELDKDLRFEVEVSKVKIDAQRGSAQMNRYGRNATVIRFTPEGFISEASPLSFWLRQEAQQGRTRKAGSQGTDGDSIWITQSRNRLNYEIQTNNLALARR